MREHGVKIWGRMVMVCPSCWNVTPSRATVSQAAFCSISIWHSSDTPPFWKVWRAESGVSRETDVIRMLISPFWILCAFAGSARNAAITVSFARLTFAAARCCGLVISHAEWTA